MHVNKNTCRYHAIMVKILILGNLLLIQNIRDVNWDPLSFLNLPTVVQVIVQYHLILQKFAKEAEKLLNKGKNRLLAPSDITPPLKGPFKVQGSLLE